MASITCKKCNVAYSDEAAKCPKCQYPTEMNDPFMWFEEEQNKAPEETMVDRYRATEAEGAAETFTDEAYIGDDYEATVVQDIEEDYYEDSVVETDDKIYEVPEVMPDVYEMSESEVSEDNYDVYEVSEIEHMPDSYIEDIPDEEEFEEDSWYDDEEADIYEDSQIDLHSGNRSDINPNAWSEEEDISEPPQLNESVAENEKVSRCKCPRCHTTHRFLPISSQDHYEKICEVCRDPFRFSLYTLVGEITKENGTSIDYHWQLQGKSKEKVHFSAQQKIDIAENDKVLLIYGLDIKSNEEKLSIIATLQGKFFIIDNIKRQHDIRGGISAAVLVPLLFIMAYFLHDAPQTQQTNMANSTQVLKSTNTQNTNTQNTQNTNTSVKNTASNHAQTPQEKSIALAIKPKIYAKNGYIYVLGQTNLPSGTQLEVTIHKEYGKKVGQANAIVHNETFQALKIPQTTITGSDGQKEEQLHSGVVIVTLYCDLYKSWKEKSVYDKLKLYTGKYISKKKHPRGHIKSLELKRKVTVNSLDESKEREQYKLQLWTVKDLSASKKWNANYYVRKLGPYIKYDPTKGDKNIIQCFYFAEANITLVANLFTGIVVAWRIGKQSE